MANNIGDTKYLWPQLLHLYNKYMERDELSLSLRFLGGTLYCVFPIPDYMTVSVIEKPVS